MGLTVHLHRFCTLTTWKSVNGIWTTVSYRGSLHLPMSELKEWLQRTRCSERMRSRHLSLGNQR